jgi:hypothetical protein
LTTTVLAGHAPVAIDLNQPGSYLNWNIFTISVANLVLIGVMVVIFGAALLLPFPGRHRPYLPPEQVAEPEQVPGYDAEPGDERMWTARARRWALGSFPPRKLLPDRQPAYVASWVYVFGVASLAALAVVLAMPHARKRPAAATTVRWPLRRCCVCRKESFSIPTATAISPTLATTNCVT